MKYFELDDEEKQILKDFEKGEFVNVKNDEEEKKRLQTYAQATLSKTKNINIRLSEKVVLKLKAQAAAKGIPYQTLVASVLHQYANKQVAKAKFLQFHDAVLVGKKYQRSVATPLSTQPESSQPMNIYQAQQRIIRKTRKTEW